MKDTWFKWDKQCQGQIWLHKVLSFNNLNSFFIKKTHFLLNICARFQMSGNPSTFRMPGKFYTLLICCTVVAKGNWVQGHADDTHKFICPHFSPDFTQSPRSCVRNGTGEESTARNMVTEKKHFHICFCSVPFCTQLRAKKIQRSKWKMTVELSL